MTPERAVVKLHVTADILKALHDLHVRLNTQGRRESPSVPRITNALSNQRAT
jgi:hypothetical protein